jgi:DNA-binding response OmpR family regulator
MKYFASSEMSTPKPDIRHPRAPRVLIVEDNTLIAMDLEDILEADGCDVLGPSVSVTEALGLLESVSADVAIVDHMLEDGTAARLAEVLAEKGVPYAICTAAGADKIRPLYPNRPILGKPYNAEDILLVVDDLYSGADGRRLKNAASPLAAQRRFDAGH